MLIDGTLECPSPYTITAAGSVHTNQGVMCDCACEAAQHCEDSICNIHDTDPLCNGVGMSVPVDGTCHDTGEMAIASIWAQSGTSTPSCTPAGTTATSRKLCCIL